MTVVVRSEPRRTPFPNEKAFTLAAQKRIRGAWGGEVLHVIGDGAQKRGTPDLIACIGGRFVAVELKQPGKVPTPLQFKRLRDWAAAGALAGWATTEAELDGLLEHAADFAWVNPQL